MQQMNSRPVLPHTLQLTKASVYIIFCDKFDVGVFPTKWHGMNNIVDGLNAFI